MSTYVTGFGLDAVRGYPYLASSSKHLSTRTYVTGFGLDAVRGYPYLATGFGLDAVRGYPYLCSSSKHLSTRLQALNPQIIQKLVKTILVVGRIWIGYRQILMSMKII
jgi:hypothetical protein